MYVKRKLKQVQRLESVLDRQEREWEISDRLNPMYFTARSLMGKAVEFSAWISDHNSIKKLWKMVTLILSKSKSGEGELR